MIKKFLWLALSVNILSCSEQSEQSSAADKNAAQPTATVRQAPSNQADNQKAEDKFPWVVERFADLRVLRYQVPGFEKLPPQQKKFLYFLSQAALSGRDIMWDQNYHLNLTIRRTLEAVILGFRGNRDSKLFKKFMVYTKQVWFSNGIHHHYSNNKSCECKAEHSQNIKYDITS